jgi:hypothetical protein
VEIKRSRRRYVVLAALVTVALLPACSSTDSTQDNRGSSNRTTSAHYPSARYTDATDHEGTRPNERYGVYTIWGQVTVRETGEPYPGATVQFSNLWGGNVHMDTDANGEYSIRAPADVYTAVALDSANMNAGFDVVGRSSNVVEIPPSTRIDFEGYPIVEGDEPVP